MTTRTWIVSVKAFAVRFTLTVMRRRATPLKMKAFAVTFTLNTVNPFIWGAK